MLCKEIVKVVKEINFWNKYIQPILFVYRTKELRILKQSLYKLIYRKELILIINYGLYRGNIIKRLLEMIDKIF